MALKRQRCDTYFAESCDPTPYEVEKNAREMERHFKKQRQLVLAEELTELAQEEYQDDHLRHMEQMELETLPDVASIDIQTEIQWFMRPYLLDFLIEAHAAFALLPETLFLTVNLLDRYCSKRVVYKKHYQLVGVTALLIASKYGDSKEKVPTIRELSKMCCSLYEEHTFTEMEWHVLQTLDWAIGHPTVDAFLQVTRDGTMYDVELEHMARYISETALFEKEFVSKRPSDIARASLALSRIILSRKQPGEYEWEADYEHKTLVGLSHLLHKPSLVLSHKYASSHLSRASKTLEIFIARHEALQRSYAPPPTPPNGALSANTNHAVTLQTPVKNQYPYNMPNGCLTPPITPDNEFYHAYNRGFGRPCPATPTPKRNQLSTQYRGEYYPPASIM